jgi:hypothetical protein
MPNTEYLAIAQEGYLRKRYDKSDLYPCSEIRGLAFSCPKRPKLNLIYQEIVASCKL